MTCRRPERLTAGCGVGGARWPAPLLNWLSHRTRASWRDGWGASPRDRCSGCFHRSWHIVRWSPCRCYGDHHRVPTTAIAPLDAAGGESLAVYDMSSGLCNRNMVCRPPLEGRSARCPHAGLTPANCCPGNPAGTACPAAGQRPSPGRRLAGAARWGGRSQCRRVCEVPRHGYQPCAFGHGAPQHVLRLRCGCRNATASPSAPTAALCFLCLQAQ